MITTSLDNLIYKVNSVRIIDAYVESLNLQETSCYDYQSVIITILVRMDTKKEAY